MKKRKTIKTVHIALEFLKKEKMKKKKTNIKMELYSSIHKLFYKAVDELTPEAFSAILNTTLNCCFRWS